MTMQYFFENSIDKCNAVKYYNSAMQYFAMTIMNRGDRFIKLKISNVRKNAGTVMYLHHSSELCGSDSSCLTSN